MMEVIVEDVMEEDDEDEDEDDDVTPTMAARTPSPSSVPQMMGSAASLCADTGVKMGAQGMRAVSMGGGSSSLSPLTTLFFPTERSAG
jgi:hypothetical protein